MEMDDQTTPASPVAVDPLDEPPPPTTTDSEDVDGDIITVFRLLQLFQTRHQVWMFRQNDRRARRRRHHHWQQQSKL